MSTFLPSFLARRLSGVATSGAEASNTSSAEEGGLSHANHRQLAPASSLNSTTAAPDGANNRTDAQESTLESPFLSNQRSATSEQEVPSSEPIDIARSVTGPSNPGLGNGLDAELRALHLDTPFSPSSDNTLLDGRDTENRIHGRNPRDGATTSESLPADDGMRHLRERIHQLRELAIGDDDKARMMHRIMTEQYNRLRPQSPSSFVSHDRPFTPTSNQSVFSDVHISSPISPASEIDAENPFNLRPGDTAATYRLRSSPENAEIGGEDEDFDTAEDGSSLGCQHYKRNVKVQCHACRRWYTCRHCHDAVEDHNLNRKKTENMLCMACGTPQKASGYCSHCGIQAAWYYCDICKLWDDNSSKKIYHCADCGICRKGEGLGKDFIHCKVRMPYLLLRLVSHDI
jgi:uncharacterized CHY-type Zn-finger protein